MSNFNQSNGNRFQKPRTNDPQIVVEGRLKQGPNADTITFHVQEGLFERVYIVTIPPDGEDSAPVYIKHKVHFPQGAIDYRNDDFQGQRRPRRVANFRGRGDDGVQDDDELPADEAANQ